MTKLAKPLLEAKCEVGRFLAGEAYGHGVQGQGTAREDFCQRGSFLGNNAVQHGF